MKLVYFSALIIMNTDEHFASHNWRTLAVLTLYDNDFGSVESDNTRHMYS